MTSKALRRNAAALILAALTAFSASLPAYALGKSGRRADNDAAWVTPERGFIALLFRWIAKAGGAMDPNGKP